MQFLRMIVAEDQLSRNWLVEAPKRQIDDGLVGAHLRFVKNFAGLPFFFMEERAACCGR